MKKALILAGGIAQNVLIEKGHRFKGIESNGDRAAGFFVQDDDYEKLLEKYETAVRNLKVLDRDGNDLVRYDLY